MNKNHIISVIVIVIIIAAVAFISKGKNSEVMAPVATSTPIVSVAPSTTPSTSAVASPSPTQNTAAKVVVTYSATGFSPKSVTVKKGETVEFVNESGKAMSAASDPHPTHVIYPEFDQYKTSSRGQGSFVFTFDKVGSWGYHNHAQSSHTGTVIVTN